MMGATGNPKTSVNFTKLRGVTTQKTAVCVRYWVGRSAVLDVALRRLVFIGLMFLAGLSSGLLAVCVRCDIVYFNSFSLHPVTEEYSVTKSFSLSSQSFCFVHFSFSVVLIHFSFLLLFHYLFFFLFLCPITLLSPVHFPWMNCAGSHAER